MSRAAPPTPLPFAAQAARQDVEALTGLRAVAAGWVVLLHAWIAGGAKPLAIGIDWTPLARAGWLGVDLFFALSGFLLTQQALARRARGAVAHTLGEPAGRFLARRVLRVFPAYLATLTVLLGLALAGVYGAVPSVPDFLLHLPMLHGLDEHFATTINGVFWSLPFELQFYVLFPLLFWLVLRSGPVALVVASLAIAHTALYVGWVLDEGRLMTNQPLRLDTFVVGLAAACFVSARTLTVPVARLAWIGGLLAMAATPFVFPEMAGHRYWSAAGFVRTLWIDAALFAILVGLAAGDHWGERVLGNAVVAWLGAVSYGIYLVHVPVIEVLETWQLFPPREHPPADIRLVLLWAVPVTVAIAALLHYAIERPFQAAGGSSATRGVRAPFSRRGALLLVLAWGLALAAWRLVVR